ncbi:hypothetical protein RUM44_008039 [Polyplax serrata]|uniref:Uncharacterized protein n=1 Tax=Polyplax serrata TaxID=468196 RepID=A0ABR1B7N1_POLSC
MTTTTTTTMMTQSGEKPLRNGGRGRQLPWETNHLIVREGREKPSDDFLAPSHGDPKAAHFPPGFFLHPPTSEFPVIFQFCSRESDAINRADDELFYTLISSTSCEGSARVIGQASSNGLNIFKYSVSVRQHVKHEQYRVSQFLIVGIDNSTSLFNYTKTTFTILQTIETWSLSRHS